MRQIGTLPRNVDPQVFGDHLLAQGMKTRFDESPDGWLVWIYNEDHVDQARSELETYLAAARTTRDTRRPRARPRKSVRGRRSSTGNFRRTFARSPTSGRGFASGAGR